MRTALVTGADGFLGRYVSTQLSSAGYSIRAGIRSAAKRVHSPTDEIWLNNIVELGDIGSEPPPVDALKGCDAVVHLAGRVHVMKETATDPLAAFRRVNVEGTRQLAYAALSAGVRRFVFVSTVKVNGEATFQGSFSESSEPQPCDSYAISKQEAEECLKDIAKTKGLEVTIVRPPLVYGPGVGGNLYRLIRHIYKRLPVILPPGQNKRSLISAYNLASVLSECVTNPKASNQTFLVSDGVDLSTRELISILASDLERRSFLVDLPRFAVRLCNRAKPLRKQFERLGGSLQIDSSKARDLLGWTPPVSARDGLRYTALWFAAERNR